MGSKGCAQGCPGHVWSPSFATPAPPKRVQDFPIPHRLLPPPNLTTPSTHTSWGPRRGRETASHATKGEGGRGAGFPVLLGLSFSSLKIPNSWGSKSCLEGDLSVPSHFLFRDTSPRPPPLRPHQGTLRKIKDGGGRDGGTSLFPSLPHFILGDPCPSATLHSWPLFLASCSVPFVPSPTLVLSLPRIPLSSSSPCRLGLHCHP